MVSYSSILDVLEEQKTKFPGKTIFSFSENGENISDSLTTSQLVAASQSVAFYIQQVTKSQDRILILLPPGIPFIKSVFGCLYANRIAVPAYPPKRNKEDYRVNLIAKDCDPSLIIGTEKIWEDCKKHNPYLASLNWLFVEQLKIQSGSYKWRPISNEQLAVLQYTSGSTNDPKGAMITHANILGNMATIQEAMALNQSSRKVSWLPPFHDMGLFSDILLPVYCGFSIFMMPPQAFVQKPIRWLKQIHDFQATFSGGPNFGYEVCNQQISSEECENLDLSSWKNAFTGAEPIRHETMHDFLKKFQPYGLQPEALHPCYGMAEATLMISSNSHFSGMKTSTLTESGSNPKRVVSCGKLWGDQEVIIVDPNNMDVRKEGEIGEIWCKGSNISPGYWKNEPVSQQTFNQEIGDALGFLRTGDLGFLLNGELYVTGRMKRYDHSQGT